VNAPSAIPWVVVPGSHEALDSTQLANPDALPAQAGYGAILAGSTQQVYTATVRGLAPGTSYRFSAQVRSISTMSPTPSASGETD